MASLHEPGLQATQAVTMQQRVRYVAIYRDFKSGAMPKDEAIKRLNAAFPGKKFVRIGQHKNFLKTVEKALKANDAETIQLCKDQGLNVTT
jgi:hypothetical protein